MTTHTKEIILKDSGFPLLSETIINQAGIEKGGNDIPFSRLILLKNALEALQPIPPNANTVWFDDTILLQSSVYLPSNTTTINTNSMTIDSAVNSGPTNTISAGDMTINDFGSNAVAQLNADYLQITNNGSNLFSQVFPSSLVLTDNNSGYAPSVLLFSSNTLGIDSLSGNTVIGDINDTTNKTKILLNDGHKEIDLNCVDLLKCVSGGPLYTLPVLFTNKHSGNYDYNTPGIWQMVTSNKMNIPDDQITQTNGLTTWKLDFAINCWNMTNQSDKAYAMYIEIVDNGSNSYQCWMFNNSTPYTTYKNSSGYSNTNSSQIENYVLTDYIDLSGSSGAPLTINFWRYAENPCNCDFQWLLTLAKNNLI